MPITADVEEAIDFHVRNGDLHDPVLFREIFNAGVLTKTHGPIYSALLVHGQKLVTDGFLDPHPTAGGLAIGSVLSIRSDERYQAQPNALRDPDLLAQFHKDVLAGKHPSVGPEHAMSIENSVQQVIDADYAFCGDEENVGFQAKSAAVQYDRVFKPETMPTPDDIRALHRANSPSQWDKISYDKMTHLNASNAGIAQMVQGQLAYAKLHGLKVRIIDKGSGTGSTISSLIFTVIDRMDLDDLPEIAITCIEQTPYFHTTCCDYVEGPDGAAALGLSVNKVNAGDPHISEFGAITVVYGDIAKALSSMDTTGMGGDDELIIDIANYVDHRRASDVKSREMSLFAQFHNSVSLRGDLKKNTSVTNREKFNPGANGWWNAGNRRIEHRYERAGYEVIDIADLQPSAVDLDLRRHWLPDSINSDSDGHMIIAAKGPRAYNSLILAHPGSSQHPVIRTQDVAFKAPALWTP